MAEFEIGGLNYRTDKMPAMTQFHVARRVAPLLGAMSDLFAKSGELKLDSKLSESIMPIADALSKMPDADCERVLADCLSVVRMQQGQNWSPIWNKSAGRLQFDTIDVAVMLQLAARVIMENAAPFFPPTPSASANLETVKSPG